MKILHIIKWLGVGGVETWLINVLRNIDKEKFSLDIVVQDEQPGTFDEEAKRLGARVIYCGGAPNPFVFAKNFLQILKQFGPYDVVHSHVHHFSGFVLALAQIAGIRGRLAHCHTYQPENIVSFRRGLYLRAMKILVSKCATKGFAVSDLAGRDLFAANWGGDNHWQILPCAIDCEQFMSSEAGNIDLRTELGLPDQAVVIGHVGRFAAPKNHQFIIEVAADILKKIPHCYLLLVGGGPLQQQIEQQAVKYDVADRVIFAGIRNDVANLMKSVMDVFFFPSLHEGLGLVLVEAQAAGLPCLVSDAVPSEAFVIPELVKSCSLDKTKKHWQGELEHLVTTATRISSQEAVPRLQAAELPLCLERNILHLQKIYEKYRT